MTDTPQRQHLASTTLIDSDHPAVRAFAQAHSAGSSERERAVSLYYAVRDGFRYDPYRIDLRPEGMRASQVIANGYGWCVPKSALLCAAARAAGISARVGYADVRNHLSTARMRETMKTDQFIWHGYAELWIENAWRKATPVFNIELCDKFGLLALEWDGLSDSLYQAHDKEGRLHMEYLKQRGSFDDMPLLQITADFAALYPNWAGLTTPEVDFAVDVDKEVG